MSRLEELIQELCPDGVQYKPLWSVTFWDKRFQGVDKKKQQKVGSYHYLLADELFSLSVDGGDVFLLSTGEKTGWTTEELAGDNLREGEVVTIPWGKSRPVVDCIKYYKGKFVTADNRIMSSLDTDVLMNRYLYHWVLSQGSLIDMFYRGSGIKHPEMAKVLDMEVPVPPLEVQREIVRVLDNFTLLRQELSAELSARRKQYEYYRDELLTFDADIPKKKLGDTCDMKAGKAISSELISDVKTEEMSVACYGGNGIRGYVKEYNKVGDYPIVGRQGALCGNVTYATGKFYATEHAVVVESKGMYSQRFLHHLLTHMDLNQYKSAGAQPGLSVKNLNELYAPVPPMDVQNKIANVLDNFEAICNDLNIGLPAEINARTRQYEFYRDQLLTFTESGKTILTDRQTDRQTRRNLIKLLQYVFGWSYVSLEDISENCDSMRRPVTKGNRNAGKYPYYGASGVVDYVDEYIYDGDYLLISEDGANLLARTTPIAFSISGKNWVNNHAHVLSFENKATQKYIEIYLNGQDLSPYISGGAQPKLNQKSLNSIQIPLPEHTKLEKIVSVLTKFESLCDNFETGIPAEIEARTKQYEYYRDKLLSFKRIYAS